MNILFLDDDPRRHEMVRAMSRHLAAGDKVTHVRTLEEVQEAMGRKKYGLVLLDYDLDHFDPDVAHNGRDVALWIAGLPKDQQPELAVVHSINYVGAITMRAILLDAGIRAVCHEFGTWVLGGGEPPSAGEAWSPECPPDSRILVEAEPEDPEEVLRDLEEKLTGWEQRMKEREVRDAEEEARRKGLEVLGDRN